MKSQIVLVALVVILAGLFLSEVTESDTSIADSNLPNDEPTSVATREDDFHSFASATITITW